MVFSVWIHTVCGKRQFRRCLRVMKRLIRLYKYFLSRYHNTCLRSSLRRRTRFRTDQNYKLEIEERSISSSRRWTYYGRTSCYLGFSNLRLFQFRNKTSVVFKFCNRSTQYKDPAKYLTFRTMEILTFRH